jgi:hypothetical protein
MLKIFGAQQLSNGNVFFVMVQRGFYRQIVVAIASLAIHQSSNQFVVFCKVLPLHKVVF